MIFKSLVASVFFWRSLGFALVLKSFEYMVAMKFHEDWQEPRGEVDAREVPPDSHA